MTLLNHLSNVISRQRAGRGRLFSSIQVIERDQYRELKKTYKVSLPDLFRVIQNELKVLATAGVKVLWLVRKLNDGQYNVSYAIIDQAQLSTLTKPLSVVCPETWLLYFYCQPGQLYRVDTAQPYWVLLDQSGHLHTTYARGLMQRPENFLSALGGVATKAFDVLPLTLEHLIKSAKLPLWAYAGLICVKPVTKQPVKINWPKLGILFTVMIASYSALTSAALVYTERKLEADLKELQAKANAFFSQQSELEGKLNSLSAYTVVINQQPLAAAVLSDISQTMPEQTVLQSIRLNGRLIQISGSASSATEVLARFSESSQFSEVRFDRAVQRVRERDNFTLSLVYQPTEQGVQP